MLDGAELALAIAANPDDTEAGLIAYEQQCSPAADQKPSTHTTSSNSPSANTHRSDSSTSSPVSRTLRLMPSGHPGCLMILMALRLVQSVSVRSAGVAHELPAACGLASICLLDHESPSAVIAVTGRPSGRAEGHEHGVDPGSTGTEVSPCAVERERHQGACWELYGELFAHAWRRPNPMRSEARSSMPGLWPTSMMQRTLASRWCSRVAWCWRMPGTLVGQFDACSLRQGDANALEGVHGAPRRRARTTSGRCPA